MTLGLLAPGALLLGLVALGPILAHLTRQQIRDRRAFGAMLLLRRLQKRVQRRRRLSDLLLLALRVAALALLVLAAARPELRWPRVVDTFGATGRVVVLLDTSMSMDQRVHGEPAFALARKDAAATVRGLPAGVQVALITAGGTAAMVTPQFSEDPELVAAQIESTEMTAEGTDLSGAFTLARTLLQGKPGEVVVYTDGSGPGVIEACQNDLERLNAVGSVVIPRVFAPDVPRNVVPVEAAYGDGVEGGTVTVKLVNYGPEEKEAPTSLFLPDGTRLTSFVSVPAGGDAGPGSVEVRFTVPRQSAGGVARVEVDDADLPTDNVRYFHLPRVGASRVVLVDGDPGSTPTRSETYFLERALAPWTAGGIAVDVVSPAGLGVLDPAHHRVVFVANVPDPGPLAPRLVEFVRAGGGVVFGMGENVTAERYNLALASLLPAPLRKVRDLVALGDGEGAPLALPDVQGEDLFRPFARAGREGFGLVRSRRVVTTDPYAETDEVHTLLRYEDGVPALIERTIGAGHVLVWTGTLDLGWGNFPLQAVYPALMQRLVSWLGGDVGVAAETMEGTVGVPVELKLPSGGPEVELTGPDGALAPADRQPGIIRFVPTAAGAWTLAAPDQPPLLSVAVNVPTAESDVRRTTTLEEQQVQVAPEATTAREPLDRHLAAAAAVLLLGAAFLGRRRTPEDPDAAGSPAEAA